MFLTAQKDKKVIKNEGFDPEEKKENGRIDEDDESLPDVHPNVHRNSDSISINSGKSDECARVEIPAKPGSPNE